MEAEARNIQPRNNNGGEAGTMNLPLRLAVYARRIVECEWRQCRLLQLNSSLLVAVGGSFVIPEYGVHSAKVAAL